MASDQKSDAKQHDFALEKLKLESQKIEAEVALLKSTQLLENARFEKENSKPWYTLNLPWLAPTLGALIAIGSLVANQYFERESRERSADLQLESRRFDHESKIIIQATDGVTAAQAVKNLEFYLNAGIITDENGKIGEMLDNAEVPVTNTQATESRTCNYAKRGSDADLTIINHLIANSNYCQTPNAGGSLINGQAKFVVVDFSASPNLEGTVDWFLNPNSYNSSHIVIGRDGTIVQLVPFNKSAWHAGKSQWNGISGLNQSSIGVELINWGELTMQPDGQNWVSWNGSIVPGQEVAVDGVIGWHRFSEMQILGLVSLLRSVRDTYGISLEDIVSQSDISPGRKPRHGDDLLWERVRAALR